jgi:hypothetical protein
MASCTFHAYSMHPSVLIPPAVETSKSDCILWYSAPLRGVLGKTFLRLLCGATLIPCRTSEHDTSVFRLPSRPITCGFHASLLQDAFRVRFELPVTTWETSNHLCTLEELAVVMAAGYSAELLWCDTHGIIDLSTKNFPSRRCQPPRPELPYSTKL